MRKERKKLKVHHIAIYTPDLERLRKFYCNYFNAKSNELYHNEETDLMTYFLTFDDGSKIEIMTKPELSMINNKFDYFGFSHIAMAMESKKRVDEITEKIKNDGYELKSEPRITGDGYYESCILDPDGNKIEIIFKNN